jgi:hypothetical protein
MTRRMTVHHNHAEATRGRAQEARFLLPLLLPMAICFGPPRVD